MVIAFNHVSPDLSEDDVSILRILNARYNFFNAGATNKLLNLISKRIWH